MNKNTDFSTEKDIKTIIFTYAGFTKDNKEIYFVMSTGGNAIGQFLACNLYSVKEKFESKGYKVIVN